MNENDLEVFAIADGLLDQIAQQRAGLLTDTERMTLLDRARESLARGTGSTLDEAGRAMHEAARHGDVTLQASDQFAVVSCWGRVLTVATRAELRGACHPESN
jgi:hypothetical protein